SATLAPGSGSRIATLASPGMTEVGLGCGRLRRLGDVVLGGSLVCRCCVVFRRGLGLLRQLGGPRNGCSQNLAEGAVECGYGRRRVAGRERRGLVEDARACDLAARAHELERDLDVRR